MKRNTLPLGLVFIAILVLTSACLPELPTETEAPQTQPAPDDATETPEFELTEIPLPAGYGAHASWIDIYFTAPENPLSYVSILTGTLYIGVETAGTRTFSACIGGAKQGVSGYRRRPRVAQSCFIGLKGRW